jgi:hypothetical protein
MRPAVRQQRWPAGDAIVYSIGIIMNKFPIPCFHGRRNPRKMLTPGAAGGYESPI